MYFTTSTYTSDMEILVTPKNLVCFSATVLQSNVVNADEDGKKYIVAGSLIDKDGNVVKETSATTGGTAGVYTLTISTALVVGDVITINGTDYTAVASGATGNQFIPGTTAAENATALAVVVGNNLTAFTVTASTNTLVFTQKVNGVGNIPVISVTGTGVAAIVQTTAGVLETTTYSLSSIPVGALYNTVDVTHGDSECSLIDQGYLRKDRVLDGLFDNTLTAVKAALPRITFK